MTKRLQGDAAGRLVRVDENASDWTQAGTYKTTYFYNGLDKLTGVVQGALSRSYSYDGIGRLLSSTNPERGILNYSYDLASNLTGRVTRTERAWLTPTTN